jgi:ferric-dicitrate binding protein FerR (iron transport regulator)
MSDDYLVDKRGTPDPEVQRLEELLADARYAPGKAKMQKPHRSIRAIPWALAASLLVLGGSAAVLRAWRPWLPSFAVQWIGPDGQHAGKLRLGKWLETDARTRALVAVANIGEVQLAPDSRLLLEATGPSEHRLLLARGALQAKVNAPPRIFVVDTPTAKAVDLGCEYQLSVDANGTSVLRVLSGAVSLLGHDAETRVEAGYECETIPRSGPGLPVRFDAPSALRDAAHLVDHGDGAAWQAVIANAGAGDEPTLWHLLPRVGMAARERVQTRLGELVKSPACRVPQIRAINQAAMEDCWNAWHAP